MTEEVKDEEAIDVENAAIDKENETIDVENAAIDAENSGIDADNEAVAKEEDIVAIGDKATIDWLDDEGNVTDSEKIHRSPAAVYPYLSAKLRDVPCDTKIKVYIDAVDSEKDKVQFVLVEGTLEECVTKLAQSSIPARIVMTKLQHMVAQMSEMSGLKCVIITGVFDDAEVGGFGYMSEAIEVTDEDIMVVGEAAASQAELFKDAMRKKRNIQFPSDSTILTASGAPTKIIV